MKNKIVGLIIFSLLVGFSVSLASGNVTEDIEVKNNTTGKSGILDYWIEQEKLQSSDCSPGDYFGCSVKIDGNYAIVGAYKENDDTGSAYIYSRDGENWIEVQKLSASDGEPGDNFGKSVSIFENLVVVGAPGDDGNTGSAYLFNNSGSTWIEEQKLISSDGEPDDLFGSSVSINKKIAIVGAYADDNFKGSVYAYNYSSTNNTEFIKLEAVDGEIGDCFGYSLSYDGRFVIIGAIGDDNQSGSAYILEYCCYFKWREKVNVSSGDPYFGCSVSIDGDYAIIGSPGLPLDGITGSVNIFKRDENNWFEHTFWNETDNGEYLFGSVSIDGGHAIAGSYYFDDGKGSAYVFKRNGTIWEKEQKLTALDSGYGDKFGISVSIDAGYIIVGAECVDACTGSAYVFMKIGVPDLTIDIIGGFGANIIITNNGENDTEEFDVEVFINGGIFKMVKKSFNFSINLHSGESKQLSTSLFFGLGKVYITATTPYKEKTVFALQLLIYTFIQ
ncbi:MAG: hypothetical protein AYK22_02035 [Thermoplasmatales archaeon SG8-52-3]|nr:MAG: hypothetical protein AYK22_02035 [Thermoplasmatales archaeon SG8-52-3]